MFELEKTPQNGPSLNKPESGTYGEKVDLARLQGQLPPMGPAGGPGGGPGGPPGGPNVPPGGPPASPGVPGGVLRPTDRPNVPLSTPLVNTGQQAPQPGSAREVHIQVLQALVADSSVSEVTRQWAESVLEAYA